MNIQKILEELRQTQKYKEFSQKNPDSFIYAIFSIIDTEKNTGEYQFDFFIPKEEKIASISYPFETNNFKVHEDKIKNIKPIPKTLTIDIDNLQTFIKKAKEENQNSQFTTKIIAVLREGIWDITCMSAAMDILRIKLDAVHGKTLEFKKSGLKDFIRVEKLDK